MLSRIGISRELGKIKQENKAIKLIMEAQELKLRALKKKNEELEKKATILNLIIENTSLGIVLSQGIKLIKVNSAFQKLLGYTKKELESMTVKDVSHPEDAEQSIHLIEKLDHSRQDSFKIKKKYRTKKGTDVVCKTTVNAVRNPKGDVKYRVAFIEDVSVQEIQARMLNAINELSSSILGKDNLKDISWSLASIISKHLDLEECVIYIVDKKRDQLTQITDYRKEGIEGYRVNKKLSLKKGIIGSVVQSGSSELVGDTRKDKRYIKNGRNNLSKLVVPIIVNSEVIGIIDSEHLEENHFKKEHLKMFANMANLAATQFNNALITIKEKKVKKENKKLLTKLKKNNEELKNFAQVVSHDLKSPLRGISTLVSWIKEDNDGFLDKNTSNNLNTLLLKVKKMDKVIDGILDYSNINKSKEFMEEVDLEKLIQDLVKRFNYSENVQIEIKSSLPNIYSNKVRVQQLFFNMIENAINHNDKEHKKVEIKVEEKKDSYVFSIKDNGPGIEEKYHNKIFEIFQKLETKEDTSIGLGLSTVKKIIKMFEGHIWLESTQNVGTTFFFELKK